MEFRKVRIKLLLKDLVNDAELSDEFVTGTDMKLKRFFELISEMFCATFAGRFKDAKEAWKLLDELNIKDKVSAP